MIECSRFIACVLFASIVPGIAGISNAQAGQGSIPTAAAQGTPLREALE
jgi:hypothetical protein